MNKRRWTYVLARTGASEGAVDGQSETEGLSDGVPVSEGAVDGQSEAEGLPVGVVAGIEDEDEDGNSEEVGIRDGNSEEVGIGDGNSEEVGIGDGNSEAFS